MKIIILSLIVLTLFGCSTPQKTKQNRTSTEIQISDETILSKPKVVGGTQDKGFIKVQGVYTLPTLNRLIKASSKPMESIWSFDHFSYIPNTGNSFSEAIKIVSWNMHSGALGEGILLSVLFGAKAQSKPRDYRTESIGKKHYHIYEIETSDNSRDVYFDATQYHMLY